MQAVAVCGGGRKVKVCMDSNVYIDMVQGKSEIANFLAECEEIIIPAATFAEITEAAAKENTRAKG